eukprot:5497183-Amphidinium_carterae.1
MLKVRSQQSAANEEHLQLYWFVLGLIFASHSSVKQHLQNDLISLRLQKQQRGTTSRDSTHAAMIVGIVVWGNALCSWESDFCWMAHFVRIALLSKRINCQDSVPNDKAQVSLRLAEVGKRRGKVRPQNRTSSFDFWGLAGCASHATILAQ